MEELAAVESRVDGTIHSKRRRRFRCHRPQYRPHVRCHSHQFRHRDDRTVEMVVAVFVVVVVVDDNALTSSWNTRAAAAAGVVVSVTIGNQLNPRDFSIELVVMVEAVQDVAVAEVVGTSENCYYCY